MEIDRSRFNFIRAKGILYTRAMQRVDQILQGFMEGRPYTIDWEDVLRSYEQRGIGDICEFASSYAFGWHASNGKLEDDTSKHAMYLEIVEGIVKRKR